MRLRSKVSWEGKLMCPACSKIPATSASLWINAGSSEACIPFLGAAGNNTSERLRETQIVLFTCHLSDLILSIQSTN